MFCPFCRARPAPLPPLSSSFVPPFFSLVKSPWMLASHVPSFLSASLLLYLPPPPPPHILACSSPVAKVSVGHIKAHKSLVCGRALNHQSEVVYKSDFKLVCDYPGTWRDTEVAGRVRDKAAALQRGERRDALGCFLSLLRKIELKLIFVSPTPKS